MIIGKRFLGQLPKVATAYHEGRHYDKQQETQT